MVSMVSKYGLDFAWKRTGVINTHGISFRFYSPDLTYLIYHHAGHTYEYPTTLHMKRLMGEGAVCFLDIGSHYGYYTSYIGKLNPKCSIYSFEPNGRYCDITRKNIRLNGLNAKAFAVALSDSEGEIPFTDRTMLLDPAKPVIRVSSIPFDELKKREGISPDVAKIDVHGSEGKVLFGMKETLKKDLKHLYLELHRSFEIPGYSVKEILDLLVECGFTLYEMDRFRFGEDLNLNPIDDDLYRVIVTEAGLAPRQRYQRMIYAVKEQPPEYRD